MMTLKGKGKTVTLPTQYLLLIKNVMKQTRTLCLVVLLWATFLHVCAAEWEKPVPPECTPAAGQSYYLYNHYAEQFVGQSGIQAPLDAN